jgi:mannose-1-phosphate guanylyltransferase
VDGGSQTAFTRSGDRVVANSNGASARDSVLVVVMAGGQGTRFWPVSRASRPKQFLSISDDGESLLQATVRRVQSLVSAERTWILSNETLKPLINEHVPGARVVCEPVARNTAACIGLAAVHALAHLKGEDPCLVVLPADHAIKDEAKLCRALQIGCECAKARDVLVTIGIPPNHPHTGYGYIKSGRVVSGRVSRVERFYEKPSLERAQKYIESGKYLWNSGMFVGRSSVILQAFQDYLPEMHAGLMAIKALLESGSEVESAKGIQRIFDGFESVSIDFGILEHARNCVVVEAEEFGWNDVGSWDQWAENFAHDGEGNLVKGDALVIDSRGCVVQSNNRLVAVVGLADVVVIDTGDALLCVGRESVQDVRKVVEELRRRGRTEML